jgi:DNA polymerase-3 subunit epsilon
MAVAHTDFAVVVKELGNMMSEPGYAVVDLETTGLFPGRHDRVVEIGVVLVDRDGTTVGEWCSLVNPRRDLGPQHIHGIQARDVLRAPSFAEVAGDVAALLAGRVVVSHNLAFDTRFLVAEYARLGATAPLERERGLCTMHLSGQYLNSPARSLSACCASAGITHDELHSALHDARACAGLLTRFVAGAGRPEPWFDAFRAAAGDRWPVLPAPSGRTAVRQSAAARPAAFLARLVNRLPRVPRADDYLALLDRALLDRHLSTSEQDALIEVAADLTLSYPEVVALHRDYLGALARVAWADGVITDDERADLLAVAELLGCTADDVDSAVDTAISEAHHGQPAERDGFRLRPGDVVVFTGQMAGTRDEWEARAVRSGLRVTGGGVTRKTRLLVAADPDSLSGKAAKARQYGVPIVTVTGFDNLLAGMDRATVLS